MATVRICPVCTTENAPAAQRCESCGAMLIGVDLSEQTPEQAPKQAAEQAQPPAAAPQPAAATPRKCPHADCGQLNSPDAERCVYCDRPLDVETTAPLARIRAALRWPWNEELEIAGRLLIGREPPVPAALAARLEHEYSNVSRLHAELLLADGALWIADLGSSNGTFVNDIRLAPRQRVRLFNGARLRFAANLTAVVAIGDA